MSEVGVSERAEWKAPSEDGQFLIWPRPDELIEQTRRNQSYLQRCEARIQNLPLRELRLAERRWLGHAQDGRPLIASGHQVELYHPGVWAKDVLNSEVAGKMGGEAYHFAVDTDAPKHLHLRWPGGSRPITDDPRLAGSHWVGLLEAPTPLYVDEVAQSLAQATGQWGFEPLAGEFLTSLKRLGIESRSLSENLVGAIHELDWKLGLRYHAMVTSPIWQSPGYLSFAHHILGLAHEFAKVYNAALAEYRRQMNIRNAGRPWPDLRISADEREAPFWCDDLAAGTRRRLTVRAADGGWAIECGGDRFALDAAAEAGDAAQHFAKFLTEHSMRLSPRALTLTMFLRLLVADQFVHGIGGGRYDGVTDRVAERFFGVQAPTFAVTTATLVFPEAASRPGVDVNALRLEGRRLRHGWGDAEKRDLARQISMLPRNSPPRRELYSRMHATLLDAMRGPAYADWQRRFDQVQHLQAQQAELWDRELFFAMQSGERLNGLMGRYQEKLA
jgi:hypothetical protein